MTPSSPAGPHRGVRPSSSRYFRLTEERREAIKERAKARYTDAPEAQRRRVYLRLIKTGKIKRPAEKTLLRYGIPPDGLDVRRKKEDHLESNASTTSSMESGD